MKWRTSGAPANRAPAQKSIFRPILHPQPAFHPHHTPLEAHCLWGYPWRMAPNAGQKIALRRLTFAQTFSDNIHCVVRRLTIREIIAIRDGRESCPVCLHPMRYRAVPLGMAKWSPSEYSWVCDRHGHPVYLIDGSILDGDESWATRHKKDKIRNMNKHLSSILFPKSSEEDFEGEGET